MQGSSKSVTVKMTGDLKSKSPKEEDPKDDDFFDSTDSEEEEEEEGENDGKERNSTFDEMEDEDESLSWLQQFLSLKENAFLIEVPQEFIRDDFNLTELFSIVPYYEAALALLLDEDIDECEKVPDVRTLQRSAQLLYYLIHQRYILTRQGLYKMAERYAAGDFGSCPRTFCEETKVIPTGVSDAPGQHAVKLFCPNCVDVYYPLQNKFHSVDGCGWGTTFAHLFFKTFPDLFLMPTYTESAHTTNNTNTEKMDGIEHNGISTSYGQLVEISRRQSSSASDAHIELDGKSCEVKGKKNFIKIFVPKIFGFKLHQSSIAASRRQHLRIINNAFTYFEHISNPVQNQ